MNPTKTLSVDIAAAFDAVMSELASAASHPSWATEFFSGEAEPISADEIRITVPRMGGVCEMKIEAQRDYGVINIYLAPVGVPYGKPLPVRVIENGEGATVLWTLAQFPGMSNAAFEAGCASMQKELATLKSKLEGN